MSEAEKDDLIRLLILQNGLLRGILVGVIPYLQNECNADVGHALAREIYEVMKNQPPWYCRQDPLHPVHAAGP